jgi:hypothetical protein
VFSIPGNFRICGGSVFCSYKIKNLTVVRISAAGQCERAFNKLARTFAAQVETLKRYQGGGEQTMPRGVATARGGVWTAVQVGSILRRAPLR